MPPESPASSAIRPLSFTLRRHRLLLLALLCILASVIYWYTPHLSRTYPAQGTLEITGLQPLEAAGLDRLPEAALKQAASRYATVDAKLTRQANTAILTLATSANARDSAQNRLTEFANNFASTLKNTATDHILAQRRTLTKQSAELTDKETALTRDLETLRTLKQAYLADGTTSFPAQFEKVSAKLEEKEQRLRLVTGQLQRLEEYKKNKEKAAADARLAPPEPLPPPAADPAAPAVKPENDPEVVALTAQLQLLNDQADEELKNRTEQHPYVQRIRAQIPPIQERLDAAKQRAAAGIAAPANIRVKPATPIPADPSLAASFQVDFQIGNLITEKSELETQLGTLTGQRDALKKEVDLVAPARRQLEELTASLATTQKSLQAAKERLDALNARFGKAEDGKEAPLPLELTNLALAQSSPLPTFPNLSLVYPLGIALGLLAAAATAAFLHKTDHRLHDSQEAAALLDVPIVGTISEIRTPAQQLRRRAWQTVGRPAAMLALTLLLAATAWRAYALLADGTPRATSTTWLPTLPNTFAETP